jgi:hypothetical protein
MTSKAAIFLNLDDIVPVSSPENNCTYSIQQPAITIEKQNRVFRVSARFKLHVEPYPLGIGFETVNTLHGEIRANSGREPNPEWIHARFIETITLRYIHSDREWHDFEPDAPEPEAYLVTESSSHQTSAEAQLSGSAVGPIGSVKVGILKEGKVEWQHSVSPWTLTAGIEPRSEQHLVGLFPDGSRRATD